MSMITKANPEDVYKGIDSLDHAVARNPQQIYTYGNTILSGLAYATWCGGRKRIDTFIEHSNLLKMCEQREFKSGEMRKALIDITTSILAFYRAYEFIWNTDNSSMDMKKLLEHMNKVMKSRGLRYMWNDGNNLYYAAGYGNRLSEMRQLYFFKNARCVDLLASQSAECASEYIFLATLEVLQGNPVISVDKRLLFVAHTYISTGLLPNDILNSALRK